MNTRTSWMLSPTIATLILATLSSSAFATVRHWTGATNSSMSFPGNWNGNVAPQPGDDLVFELPATLAVNNDFPADPSFHSIVLARNYTLGGNEILLGDGGLALSSLTQALVSAPIKLSSAQTFHVMKGARLDILGAVNLNGQTLTVEAPFLSPTRTAWAPRTVRRRAARSSTRAGVRPAVW